MRSLSDFARRIFGVSPAPLSSSKVSSTVFGGTRTTKALFARAAVEHFDKGDRALAYDQFKTLIRNFPSREYGRSKSIYHVDATDGQDFNVGIFHSLSPDQYDSTIIGWSVVQDAGFRVPFLRYDPHAMPDMIITQWLEEVPFNDVVRRFPDAPWLHDLHLLTLEQSTKSSALLAQAFSSTTRSRYDIRRRVLGSFNEALTLTVDGKRALEHLISLDEDAADKERHPLDDQCPTNMLIDLYRRETSDIVSAFKKNPELPVAMIDYAVQRRSLGSLRTLIYAPDASLFAERMARNPADQLDRVVPFDFDTVYWYVSRGGAYAMRTKSPLPLTPEEESRDRLNYFLARGFIRDEVPSSDLVTVGEVLRRGRLAAVFEREYPHMEERFARLFEQFFDTRLSEYSLRGAVERLNERPDYFVRREWRSTIP